MILLLCATLLVSTLHSANAAGVQVWTEPAALKIFEDAKASAHATRTVRLSAARREFAAFQICLLYTSPSPRDRTRSRMPSSA